MKQEEKREKERRGEFEKERDRVEKSSWIFFSQSALVDSTHFFAQAFCTGSTVSSNAMLTKVIFKEGKHKEKMRGKVVVILVALHEEVLTILC